VTLGPYLAADDSVLKRVHLYVLASDNVQTAELYHMNQMYAKQFFTSVSLDRYRATRMAVLGSGEVVEEIAEGLRHEFNGRHSTIVVHSGRADDAKGASFASADKVRCGNDAAFTQGLDAIFFADHYGDFTVKRSEIACEQPCLRLNGIEKGFYFRYVLELGVTKDFAGAFYDCSISGCR